MYIAYENEEKRLNFRMKMIKNQYCMFSAAYHQFVLFPERSLFLLAGHIYNIIPVCWEFSVPEGGSSVGSSVGGTKYAVKMYYTLDCATISKKLVSVRICGHWCILNMTRNCWGSGCYQEPKHKVPVGYTAWLIIPGLIESSVCLGVSSIFTRLGGD